MKIQNKQTWNTYLKKFILVDLWRRWAAPLQRGFPPKAFFKRSSKQYRVRFRSTGNSSANIEKYLSAMGINIQIVQMSWKGNRTVTSTFEKSSFVIHKLVTVNAMILRFSAVLLLSNITYSRTKPSMLVAGVNSSEFTNFNWTSAILDGGKHCKIYYFKAGGKSDVPFPGNPNHNFLTVVTFSVYQSVLSISDFPLHYQCES